MLKFINKTGKKVMEVHDDGKTVIFQEKKEAPFPAELERKDEERTSDDE